MGTVVDGNFGYQLLMMRIKTPDSLYFTVNVLVVGLEILIVWF
jgi:hypothetical protein